eukprot:scaffold28187_cov54-Cyclotella_meneghiniana.AAC.1
MPVTQSQIKLVFGEFQRGHYCVNYGIYAAKIQSECTIQSLLARTLQGMGKRLAALVLFLLAAKFVWQPVTPLLAPVSPEYHSK